MDRSKQPPFRERKRCAPRNDEMVEHFDIHHAEGFLELARKQFVCLAGLRYTGRMVVGEDDCGRVGFEGCLDDLARLDAGLRERAAKQFFAREHAMLRVEEDHDEYLVLAATERKPEIVADRLG